MQQRISDLVKLIFEDIPYSPETLAARGRIESAMEGEYRSFLENSTPERAFEEIMERYGNLYAMAELAGFQREDVEQWRGAGQPLNLKAAKGELVRLRRWINLSSLLWVLAVGSLLDGALRRNPWHFLFTALFGALAFFVEKRFARREAASNAGVRYDGEAFLFLRRQADIYVKRGLNSIAMGFVAFGYTLYVPLLILGNAKLSELLESFAVNLVILAFFGFICLKNIRLSNGIGRRIGLPDREAFARHLRGVLVFSSIYWLALPALSLVLYRIYQLPSIMFFGTLVFGALILTYNFTRRRRLTQQNFIISTRRAVAVLTVFALVFAYGRLQEEHWYTQPYINSVARLAEYNQEIAYDGDTGVYTLTARGEDFKILHLTDIHLGGSLYSLSRDLKALKAVYAEIEYARPDLVIVTGDLCFPMGVMSLTLNNSAPVNQFAAFMRNVGVPWAFTYGNHDTEAIANYSAEDMDALFKRLSYKTSGTLLYPYVQPEITGRNNQLLEVRGPDGALWQALFLLDSNAYTGEGFNAYDYIHDDQVDWYASQVRRLSAEAGRTVDSMVFFHIPLQEYRTAYALYEQDSDEVKYFFGENGEEMFDKVCCSRHPSRLFDEMVELGSTKAAFCGHDHYNNISLEYRGVRLTYGMSIDYLAMPGIEWDSAQRGGELITLHPDGTFELAQIPLTSITE